MADGHSGGAGRVGEAGRADEAAQVRPRKKKRPVWREAREGRVYVRWSPALAEEICARLAAGELLYGIVKDEGMPTPEGVRKWARERPEFGEALAAAKRAGGRPNGTRGPAYTYDDDVAAEVFERLCDGESLNGIGRDPTMPSLSTLQKWRNRFAEFEETVRLGMQVRAERMADEGWELAMEATPETAYLTHVRLSHLRWLTAIMAPRRFRLKAVEPEAPPKPPLRVLLRHFEVVEDPETGELKVAAWCPNPDTGRVECEDEPGWRRPPNAVLMPGG